jgi:hypothetical protein
VAYGIHFSGLIFDFRLECDSPGLVEPLASPSSSASTSRIPTQLLPRRYPRPISCAPPMRLYYCEPTNRLINLSLAQLCSVRLLASPTLRTL